MIAPHHFWAQIMFYVYVLKSQKDGLLYIGRTSDLRRRLKEHLAGQNLSTRNRRPIKLIYYEAYDSARDAQVRETRLKQFKNGYTELKKRLRYSFVT